jgi:hypothetical protein
MKATKTFNQIIENHLQSLAANDPLFAETLKKPNKNITDCVNYILGEVQKSGCNGFADEEVYQMAVHYYDEDNIKPSKAINAKVVINQSVPKGSTPDPEKQPQSPAKKTSKHIAPPIQQTIF